MKCRVRKKRKKIKRMTVHEPWILRVQRIVITAKTKDWCSAPYPNHPKGCPNVEGRCWGPGKRRPITLFNSIADLTRPLYIVFNEFDVEAHAKKMKKRHPEWSDRQCRNLLYWQNTSHKQLNAKIDTALKLISPTPNVISSGEGYGVDLYSTCRHSGLKLEKMKGIKIVRHLVLMGYKLTMGKRKKINRGVGRGPYLNIAL